MSEKATKRLRWKIAQWFERLWWLWYLDGKEKTEYLTWKRAYWSNFLSTLGIELRPGSKVADLGCGPAGLFIYLDAQHEVEAVDPLLDHYRKRLTHFRPADYPNTRFIRAVLEDWHSEQIFDAVFCINAINHVSDIVLALQSLRRAYRSGQIVVITTDAHRYRWLCSIFALTPGDILHPHQYTIEGYLRLVQQAGWPQPETIRLRREAIFDYYALVWR